MNKQTSEAEAVSDRFLRRIESPEGVGVLPEPDGRSEAVGSCGDAVGVHIAVEDDRITEVRVQPNGCLFTLACASAAASLTKGRSLTEALELTPEEIAEELGGLPEDHLHCARLAVNAVAEAAADYYQSLAAQKRREK